MHPVTERVTQRIVERSRRTRADYLARMDAAAGEGPHRQRLSCGNLAHGFAASGEDKPRLRGAHTASLFPGASQLAAATSADDTCGAYRIDPEPMPPEAPYPRITLSLRRLLDARELHLALSGEAKRHVLRHAQTAGRDPHLPISEVLHAPRVTVDVHWSP